MGKSSKRERQKSNKAAKDQEREKKLKREKAIRTYKTLGVVLIVPIIIVISIFVNKATSDAIYTAQITVSIDGKEAGTIDVKLDQANAPKSVKHFIGYASNSSYDGVEFNIALKDALIGAGSLNEDGSGSLGSVIQAEEPPRDFKQGDLVWQSGAASQALSAGSAFNILTGDKKADVYSKDKGLNQKSQATSEAKSTYQISYIGYITKGLDIAKKIQALAPKQEIDPVTNKPKVDESGNEIPPEVKPTKTVKIVRVLVFKDGKQIKPGEYANLTTTSTSSTTTTVAP